MTAPPDVSAGFVRFFRRYTKSWLHAVSTAALTAFGLLGTFHRGFIVLAVAAYVLPPVGLYLTRGEPTEPTEVTSADEEETDASPERRPEDEPSPNSEPEPHWTAVDAPTERTLFGVAVADGDAYAVGADGIVLTDGGDGWETALTDGPGAASEVLRGVDATGDGGAVWVAGDGGTVARLDGETGRHVDFTPPRGRTDSWEDVAVAGASDDELVLLVNGSGEVLRGRYRDGDLAWSAPVKPGGGSSLSGVALADDSVGYACDTNDGVFETTDGAESFRRIGIEGADGTLTDVATAGRGDCVATADDGVLHRHDDGTWTPVRLGDDPLEAVAFEDDRGVACGGGAVYERDAGDAGWNRFETSEAGPLVSVAVSPVRAVAVGSDGAIVERET